MPVAGLNCHKHCQLPEFWREREAEAGGNDTRRQACCLEGVRGVVVVQLGGEVMVM